MPRLRRSRIVSTSTVLIVASEADRELTNTLGRALSGVISRRVTRSRVIIDSRIIDIRTDDAAREPHSLLNTIPDWFVVLLTTDSTATPAFDTAVGQLTRDADPRRILLALSSGRLEWDHEANDFNEHSNVVPQSLHGRFDEMPYHLDLRWASGNPAAAGRSRRFESALAALAAPIVGLQKELVLQPRVRAGVITLAGLALVAPVAGVAFIRLHNPSNPPNRITATEPTRFTTPTTTTAATPATTTTITAPTTTTTATPCGGAAAITPVVVTTDPIYAKYYQGTDFSTANVRISNIDSRWGLFDLLQPGFGQPAGVGVVHCDGNRWVLKDIGTEGVGCPAPADVRAEFKLLCSPNGP